MPRARSPNDDRRRGAYSIEFALVLMVFLALMFSMIEMARLVYLFATLVDSTQRAARLAATVDFSDAAALDLVRQQAMPRDGTGRLVLGGAIDPSYLKIDYLNASNAVVNLPCPAANYINCASDPTGAGCIRAVRARLCQPGTDCDSVRYAPLLPLPGLANLTDMPLPTFQSVAPATNLGYVAGGSGSCP